MKNTRGDGKTKKNSSARPQKPATKKARKSFCEKRTRTVMREKLYAVLAGASAGLINGVFGGGGGMIIVPILEKLLKKKPETAHATAIFLILPMSVISGLLYASFGTLDLKVGLPVCVGVTLGGALGALVLGKLPSKIVAVLFAVVTAAAGVKTAFF